MTECTWLGIKKHNSSCEKTLEGRPFWTGELKKKEKGNDAMLRKGSLGGLRKGSLEGRDRGNGDEVYDDMAEQGQQISWRLARPRVARVGYR